MTVGMQIKVNGTPIKSPTTCIVGKFAITKAGRVASGSMAMDLIAKKTKLSMTYEALAGADLLAIENLVYYTTSMFFTVTYYDDDGNTMQTKTMYVGDITYDRFCTDGTWIWKNIKMDFIEQ